MNDIEFITEAIDRLVPNSEWHGESDADAKSLANVDIQEEVLRIVWNKLFADLVVYGHEENASAQALMQRKKEALLAAFARVQENLLEIDMFAPLYYEEEEDHPTSTI